ncbi:MAG TPA: MerC domain-containing protein [Candidatus Elarobacter sp.]|nr:MerC domain-containing protein [Candidatus Elarobacter sp.]
MFPHILLERGTIMNRTSRALPQFAGGAGVVAASCAALCCAGAPIIVSVLAATGLSFLRTDAILLPIIGVALIIALAGFWAGRRIHRSNGPFMLGVVGSVALVAGVVFVHGVSAKVLIGAGAILLLVAMLWNARLPQACDIRGAEGR